MKLEIVAAGARSSLEGQPRYGRAHDGVSCGGAGDPWAAAVANGLVGNEPGALVVEMVLTGATVRVAGDAGLRMAFAGARFDVDGAVPWAQPFLAQPGDVIRVRGCARGLRCSLAVAGGLVDAAGRVLAKGDVVVVGGCGPGAGPGSAWSEPWDAGGCVELRATPGPHDVAGAGLWETEWTVGADSDRRGIRLAGPALERPPGDVVTFGVTVGSVQVTPAGQPVILFVERATTGGYAQGAHVARVDLWKLGQLRPGSRVRFTRVTFDEARALWRSRARGAH